MAPLRDRLPCIINAYCFIVSSPLGFAVQASDLPILLLASQKRLALNSSTSPAFHTTEAKVFRTFFYYNGYRGPLIFVKHVNYLFSCLSLTYFRLDSLVLKSCRLYNIPAYYSVETIDCRHNSTLLMLSLSFSGSDLLLCWRA